MGSPTLTAEDNSFQDPLETDLSTSPLASAAGRLKEDWMWEAMESALQLGLLGIAEKFAEDLSKMEWSRGESQRLLDIRFKLALIRGDLIQGRKLLNDYLSSGLGVDPILYGFWELYAGKSDVLVPVLTTEESKDDEQIAWQALLEALRLDASGDRIGSREAMEKAIDLAPSTYLKEHFELVGLRQTLSSGPVGPDAISALRESVRSMASERGGFEAARLLAIALYKAGEQAQAVDILGSHLSMPEIREYGLRSDFLLLVAVIAGPDSARGRLALEQLISEAEDVKNTSIAFGLYSSSLNQEGLTFALVEKLDEWLERVPSHPMTDRILLEKANLAIHGNDLKSASESALRIFEEFPDSIYRAGALRILAQVAWLETPPAYRTAADYLNQLRSLGDARVPNTRVSMLMADCFFMNQDYRRAAEVYASVATAEPVSPYRDQANYQRILSEIGSGRFEEAALLLDACYGQGSYSMDALWRAEWNLADALRKSGRSVVAFQRVERLLSDFDSNSMENSLRLRMSWLSARLNLENSYADNALARAEATIGELQALDGANDFKAQLESHLLLVAGEACYALERREAAEAYFVQLRQGYPDSGPSVLSYLIQSREESATDNLVSAQQSLIELVDQFPDSDYAPVALWEAALNAEQRALASSYREAIGILERLIADYPQHGLVFYARLKQGDLARLLNDFPTALSLYEACLRQFPNHSEIYRSELSRADCLMAMGAADVSRFNAAAVIYERLFFLRDAPHNIRVEAGFKWSNALKEQEDSEARKQALWMICEKFGFQPASRPQGLGSLGHYWLSRALLELAELEAIEGRLASSARLYETLIRLKLPGVGLAKARLAAIRS